MQVFKAADIINGSIRFCGDESRPGWLHMASGEILRILTRFDSVVNPRLGAAWTAEIPVENRPTPLRIELPRFISASDSLEEPLFLPDRQFVFYRNQLSIAENPPENAAECHEIIKEVKKTVVRQTSKPDQITQPPGIPRTNVRVWVDRKLAADLHQYYGRPWIIFDQDGSGTAVEASAEAVSVGSILIELDKLIGLAPVKHDVRSW